MKQYLCLVLLLWACGDDQRAPGAPADGPRPDSPTAPDAATPDAAACNTTGYPAEVRVLTVDLGADFPLTLDGSGERCDQIGRALTAADTTLRPPELAQLDAVGATWSCTHDDLLDREIVRLRAPLYAGKPLYHPIQDALVHVSATNAVVFLHGDFLPAGAAVRAGCLSGEEIVASTPGRPLTYKKFAQCVPDGSGSYAIASSDTIEIVDEGYYLDAGKLRRVRAIDAFLAAANVTPETTNSDLYCCTDSLDHCVGKRLFIDALTGELIANEPRCHAC